MEYLYAIFNLFRMGVFIGILVWWAMWEREWAMQYCVLYIALTIFKFELDKLIETRYTSRQETIEEEIDYED